MRERTQKIARIAAAILFVAMGVVGTTSAQARDSCRDAINESSLSKSAKEHVQHILESLGLTGLEIKKRGQCRVSNPPKWCDQFLKDIREKEGERAKTAQRQCQKILESHRRKENRKAKKEKKKAARKAAKGCFEITGDGQYASVKINGVQLTLLVDTGANVTTLTQRQAFFSEVDGYGTTNVIVADGRIVRVVSGFAEIQVGKRPAKKIDVHIMETGKIGLLGNNVLKDIACRK